MKLGIVMDPIESINFKKDSTLAMMLEAQAREHQLFYMTPNSLYLNENGAYALSNTITVKNDSTGWFQFHEEKQIKLSELDVILMRQDPPFNSNFIYNTYVLESAEREGVLVVNKPGSLRDCNEKVFATEFPECCTPFLVTSEASLLKSFIQDHKDTVIKPLDGMGGSSIFRLRNTDPNLNVILETITDSFMTKVMIQTYIPEITDGDKRILLINGKPMNAAVARVLTEKDLWICEQVGPKLKDLGLVLVGLDIIGDYLTEINVTSPTCFREYESLCDINVALSFLDVIEDLQKNG